MKNKKALDNITTETTSAEEHGLEAEQKFSLESVLCSFRNPRSKYFVFFFGFSFLFVLHV